MYFIDDIHAVPCYGQLIVFLQPLIVRETDLLVALVSAIITDPTNNGNTPTKTHTMLVQRFNVLPNPCHQRIESNDYV